MRLNKQARTTLKRILAHLRKHVTDHESLDGSFEGYMEYQPWSAVGGEGFLEWNPDFGILLVDRHVEGHIRREGSTFRGYVRMALTEPGSENSKEIEYVAHNLRDALARLWMEGVMLKNAHYTL